MIDAKIRLSPKEMELVTDPAWILTKNGVMEKAKWLLEDLQGQMVDLLFAGTPNTDLANMVGTPKISKGENYRGLPYLVLDYPRIFHKKNVFAIRTFFWWGNFFSSTLHLGGHQKQQREEILLRSATQLRNENFYLSVSEDEWEHHFGPDNYVACSKLSENEFEHLVKERPFIKVAAKIPLEEWENARTKLLGNFTKLITLAGVNFRGGEIVL